MHRDRFYHQNKLCAGKKLLRLGGTKSHYHIPEDLYQPQYCAHVLDSARIIQKMCQITKLFKQQPNQGLYNRESKTGDRRKGGLLVPS